MSVLEILGAITLAIFLLASIPAFFFMMVCYLTWDFDGKRTWAQRMAAKYIFDPALLDKNDAEHTQYPSEEGSEESRDNAA